METKRGEDAWQAVKAANMFNDPPAEGMEYLLVRVVARCTSDDPEARSISSSDFRVTGDRKIRYSTASVVAPEPVLDAELYKEGETDGWVAFSIGVGETNLILLLDELVNWDDGRVRYYAIDDGAAVVVSPELPDTERTYTKSSRKEPVPVGETATTDDWEITIGRVIRGDEAWTMAREANQFNDPPDDGMEYVALWVDVRRIGMSDEPENIDGHFFRVTGSANILWAVPSVVEPYPGLDVWLYPGGEYGGWVIQQAAQMEDNLMVIFEPIWSFSDSARRVLALEDGASIEIPAELSAIAPTTLGQDRNSPAPLGETVTTDEWQVRLLEVIRGGEAWRLVEEANQFNDPPAEGIEYLATRIRVRYVGTDDKAVDIDGSAFKSTGSKGTLYDLPTVVEPSPRLDVTLFPGGEHEGWLVLEAGENETGMAVVFRPMWASRQSERFLSIEP